MTPIQLRYAALRETGIVGILETPSPEQDVEAQTKYAGLHAQLLQDGLANWAASEDIPAGAQQPLIWMLANLVAPPIGAPAEEITRLFALGSYRSPQPSVGERMLRSYAASQYVSQPATAEYY